MALPPSFVQELRRQAGPSAEYPADAAPSLLEGEATYDFVVVGGGSSGAALAARLAAHRADWKVLVVEAGDDPPIAAEVPGLWFRLWQQGLIWSYRSETREDAFQGLRGKGATMIRGRALGGTSTINGLPYLRGHPKDYDGWGIDGWGFQDVLPFFKRSEDMRILESLPSGLHAEGGEMTIEATKGDAVDPLKGVIRAAVGELGLAEVADQSGPGPGVVGWGDVPRTQRDGLRCGAAKAFLSKAAPHGSAANLHVARRTVATKLLFDAKNRVQAVEAVVGAERTPVKVRVAKEVVLCAGAMESPKLLLLSGVGPCDDLTALGLPVVLDSPVGRGLQDHAMFPGIVFTVPPAPATADPFTAFLKDRSGPLASIGLMELMGFARTESTRDWDVPSVQFTYVRYPKGMYQNALFAAEVKEAFKSINAESDIMVVSPFLVHPAKPGRLSLRSAEPADPIKFESGLLAEQRDVDILVESARMVEQMAQTKSFKEAGLALRYIPLPGDEALGVAPGSTAYWQRCVRHLAGSAFHPVASCALGEVVDARLRVRGLAGVRVADASVLPGPVSANPNAPAIMVGERAAQFVIEDHDSVTKAD